MTDRTLEGRRIAVLATDGFEEVELTKPVEALKAAGAAVEIVAPKSGDIQGFQHHDRAGRTAVDRDLAAARPDDYDAMVLPGGVINPDALRLEPKAIEFIRDIARASKPIAAICHGPWTLIDAGVAEGKTLTSWPSLRADLSNAGAEWVDREVVVDGSLVTSRRPDDLPAFCEQMIKTFSGGADRTDRGAKS